MNKIREWRPILIFILFLPAIAPSCPTFITPNCNFLFTEPSCAFKNCFTPSQDPNRSTIRSYKWDTCINICCQKYTGTDDPPLIQTLNDHCYTESQSKILLPLGAIIAVALGLVIFIIVAIGICFYLKILTCHCPCLGASSIEEGYRENVRPAPSQLEIVQVEGKPTSYREQVFVTEEPFEARGNQRLCSICLDDQTSVSTKCGHFFHKECLHEWLKRRKSCPECRLPVLDEFLLYCSQCKKNYQKISILKEKQSYECKYCKL